MSKPLLRLQKYLAQRGVASRRRAEEMILAGRVAINGATVTELGVRVDPHKDVIDVDGAALAPEQEKARTILLHKPRGYVCSASPLDGKTVLDLLPGVKERLVPVGRLDKDSEGLLLLSNDGDLVHRLTHPRFEKEKAYRVSVSGAFSAQTIHQLCQPMLIDGYRIQPAVVREIGSSPEAGRHLLEFILREGRNRQIRNMCEAVGLKVHRLVRTRTGSLTLGGLRAGQWRDLSQAEIEALAERT